MNVDRPAEHAHAAGAFPECAAELLGDAMDASHDARVRSEAIRLQLLLPHRRDATVDAALNDSDSRIVHLGLTAIGDFAHAAARSRHRSRPGLETSAATVVCSRSTRSPTRATPSVLEAFLQLSVGGRSLFGRIRLPPKTPVLVAINALATTWADEPRASGVLAAAARSSDPELRQAVSAQTR